MNPHRIRELFADALTEPAPVSPPAADDVVAAGRRAKRRRRTAQAGSGALGLVAALALFAAAPTVLGQGETVPNAAEEDDGAVHIGPCPAPAEEPTEEQAAIAAMYDRALDAHITGLGGALGDSCIEGETDYHGFHYDAESGGYRFDEVAVFPESDERVSITVDVLDPVDGPLPDRMEGLAGCGSIDGTCTWSGDLLLVEEERTVIVDEDEDATGDRLPYHGALLGLADDTVVHVQMGVYGGPGTLSTTPEQLGELAAAIPVGGETTGGDDMPVQGEENAERSIGTDEELVGAFTDAVSAAVPGAVVDTGTPIVFADPGQDYHYGQDDTAVAAVAAVVDGREVRLFLQKTPIDASGDGAGQVAAEHYAQCSYAAECAFTEVDGSTSRVHRTVTGEEIELTSVEFRAGDGWVLGVGVAFAGGAPPLDFATLDAIVAQVG
ncbi:MAG TPA: hypothetical protein VFU12_10515 [Glycomyces sp.]|nr:hypothetical protein [Glycomyces sp.]